MKQTDYRNASSAEQEKLREMDLVQTILDILAEFETTMPESGDLYVAEEEKK